MMYSCYLQCDETTAKNNFGCHQTNIIKHSINLGVKRKKNLYILIVKKGGSVKLNIFHNQYKV